MTIKNIREEDDKVVDDATVDNDNKKDKDDADKTASKDDKKDDEDTDNDTNTDTINDPIQDTIKKIKEAKRMKMRESQENRDEDNVSADESKIEAGKGKYSDDKKHIGDSTKEWVYEEDIAEGGDDEDEEAKSKVASDDEVFATIKKTVPSPSQTVTEEDDLDEEAIAETIDRINRGSGLSEEDAMPEGSKELLDAKETAGSDGEELDCDNEVKEEVDADRLPSDSTVSSDNAKIKKGQGVVHNDKAVTKESYVTKEDFDLTEDMDAILGKEQLPESFKVRLQAIYEASVVAKTNQVISEAVQIMKEDMKAYRVKLHEQYADKINDYLNVIVEECATENKETLVENTRYDLSQSFISALKTLFENHYIEMPSQKQDIFEKILEENIELEDQVNQLLEEKVQASNSLRAVKKDRILSEACKGLSLNQSEKLKLLAESVDFNTDLDYRTHISEIREAYFPKEVKRRSIEKDTTAVVLTENVKTNSMDDDVAAVVAVVNKIGN